MGVPVHSVEQWECFCRIGQGGCREFSRPEAVQSWGDRMVARSVSQDLPPTAAYHHLLQIQEDEPRLYVHVDDSNVTPQQSSAIYYDLSQSCCSSSTYLGNGQVPTCSDMAMEVSQVDNTREHPPKKRKAASYHDGSDEDTGDDNKSVRTDEHKKQNHSEIEKRRRDKMNLYITELSAMVPMCHAMSRKLDKLTVLRMAVQHMKTIRGAVQSYADGNYKPAFLSDVHLKQIIKQAAEGFLFVVGCDRGRILYVSESVTQALNYTQTDLLGQSWFDILHPKDVAKVKEQLSSSHLSPRERFIDAKTMLPVKTDLPQPGSKLCPGARRSFFCRMKCKTVSPSIKEESETTTGCHRRKKHFSDKKYRVIQCTGYLKPWVSSTKMGLDDEKEPEPDGDSCNLSCLVAMGRVIGIPLPATQEPVKSFQPPINVRPLQFISRHAMDGKFLFVDQRATLMLGFLPQELLGTSMYEYYHKDDITNLADSHKSALQGKEPVTTKVYRFRSRDGNYIHIQSEWRSFRNPWTKEGEYLVAKNFRTSGDNEVQIDSTVSDGSSQSQGNGSFEFCRAQSNNDIGGRDISRYITSHVEASNIGRKIADEVIDEQRRSLDSPLTNTSTPSPSHLQTLADMHNTNPLSPDHLLPNTIALRTTQKSTCCNEDNYSVVRNNVTLSSIGSEAGVSRES
ncbi:basic helix-loop-helix ARNT-like protein cyc isoform X3 [Rhodnius prolixus]|uniref:basic helix-loop-helix ARNT-like protein cyc isoform X3 n=1 Tax=Rhodnius prolixus TaxID=13249 RepID=UPI003D188D17